MFALHTIMVVDARGNGLPIAWIITSSSTAATLEPVLAALIDKIRTRKPDWEPSCQLVDDDNAAINTLRAIVARFGWQTGRIYLCTWHVKRAWLKNLLKHIKVGRERGEIFDGLCDLIHGACSEGGEEAVLAQVQAGLESFCSRWDVKYPAFVQYLRRTWGDKVAMLALAFRRGVCTARQTGTQILEGFHGFLKALLSGKRIRGRRLDWLIVFLLGNVCDKFNRRLAHVEGGYIRNSRGEERAIRAIREGQRIPASHVHMEVGREGGIAHVRSQQQPSSAVPREYTVRNVFTPFVTCSCSR